MKLCLDKKKPALHRAGFSCFFCLYFFALAFALAGLAGLAEATSKPMIVALLLPSKLAIHIARSSLTRIVTGDEASPRTLPKLAGTRSFAIAFSKVARTTSESVLPLRAGAKRLARRILMRLFFMCGWLVASGDHHRTGITLPDS